MVFLPEDKRGLGIPQLKLKCSDLFKKQMFRNITNQGNGSNHVDFWLGESLGIPHLSSSFVHIKGRPGREQDDIPPLFSHALLCISEVIEGGIVKTTELEESTTKNIYTEFLKELPPPKITLQYPDQDWQ